jgi:hypothetical protein
VLFGGNPLVPRFAATLALAPLALVLAFLCAEHQQR